MVFLPKANRAALDFPCRNKGFAAHNLLHPKTGDVFDIKESFPI